MEYKVLSGPFIQAEVRRLAGEVLAAYPTAGKVYGRNRT
jgi:hypothetical protein